MAVVAHHDLMLKKHLSYNERFKLTNFYFFNGVPQEAAFNLHYKVKSFQNNKDEEHVKDLWAKCLGSNHKAIQYCAKYWTYDIRDKMFVYLNGKECPKT